MQKKINKVIVAFMVLILFSSFYLNLNLNKVRAEENSSNEKSLKLSYEVRIDDYSKHIADVTVIIENITMDNIEIRQYKYHGRSGRMNEVLKLEAFDASSKSLKTVTYDKEGYQHWKIDTLGRDKIVVKYRIRPYVSDKEINFGYVGNGFAAFNGANIFIAPIKEYEINDDISVSFKIPKGSNIVTSWYQENGVYYPLKNLGHLNWEQEHKIFPMMENTVAMGRFSVYNKMINNVEVKVAFPQNTNEGIKKQVVDSVFKLYAYYTTVVDQLSTNPMVVIFLPSAENGKDVIGSINAMGAACDFNIKYFAYNRLVHGIYHRCNSIAFEESNTGRFFDEGTNVYYEYKSQIKNMEYLFNLNDNIKSLHNMYLDYKNKKIRDEVYNKADEGVRDGGWIIYSKGALIAMALDMKIIEDTNGKKSLDDLLLHLSRTYNYKTEKMAYENIICALKNLTGKDYSEFFNNYMFGMKPIKLDRYFSDSDRDGVPNYVEILRGTNPSVYNNFSSKVRDIFVNNFAKLDSKGNIISMEIDGTYRWINKDTIEFNSKKSVISEKARTNFIKRYPAKITFIAPNGTKIVYMPYNTGYTQYNGYMKQAFPIKLDKRIKPGVKYRVVFAPSSKYIIRDAIYVIRK